MSMIRNRKALTVVGVLTSLILSVSLLFFGQNVTATEIMVYKTPTCGCCNKWVEHLRAHGFEVTTKNLQNLRMIKSMQGVKPQFASCHTALVDGYVIEGHVPGDVIQRLLAERPNVVGLTVPGMPMGSPGMEGPYSEPYDILTFDAQGKTQVYERR